MSPCPALSISGTAARIGHTVPATLVSSMVVSASSLWSRMLPYIPIPALATSVSRRPKRSTAVATEAPAVVGRADVHLDRDDPARILRLEGLEPLPAPGADDDVGARSAGSRAVARPMPALAPVMATTVSFRSSIAPV